MDNNHQDIERALERIARAFETRLVNGMDKFNVLYQDDLGNVQKGVSMLCGIGKITGVAANEIAETVTFARTFAAPPAVYGNFLGFVPTAGAFNIAAIDSSWGGSAAHAEGPTTTGFNMRMRRFDGFNYGTASDYYYSWYAIGILA